jgi:hypothetical protein
VLTFKDLKKRISLETAQQTHIQVQGKYILPQGLFPHLQKASIGYSSGGDDNGY